MRIVFGAAAVGVIAASYIVCPDEIRNSITDTVTPNEQVLVDMQDGLETLIAYFSGPEDIQPETPPV
jgi:hypothetical protein